MRNMCRSIQRINTVQVRH